MRSSLPNEAQSQEKNLSTQNSRNSTFAALMAQRDKQNEVDSSFRLFTFMNVKHDDQKMSQKGLIKSKKKSHKKIANKSLKRESSCLINMIQQSRKKRESFYKLILDNDSLSCLDNQRKCKTPTGVQLTKQNLSVKCFKGRKNMTPKANSNRSYFLSEKATNLEKKIGESKNSNSQAKFETKKQRQGMKQRMIEKVENKENEQALLRKKKDLQRQLVAINQTLLLGHQRKRNKEAKNKK